MYDGDVWVYRSPPPWSDLLRRLEERPELAMDWVQLCPQSYGVVDEGLITDLKRQYPSTKFQLHSNVRLECGKTPVHGSSHGEWVHECLDTFERLTLLEWMRDLLTPQWLC